MSHPILQKHIAIITAHPDDETFLAAGTIHLNTSLGGKTSLFCATLGEKGTSYLVDADATQSIRDIRKNELYAVARLLGIQTVVLGDFPDGAVSAADDALYYAVQDFVMHTEPDVLIGFDDDGFTGHADHISSSAVVKRVARELAIPLFVFAKPPVDVVPDFDVHLCKKRKMGTYVDTTISSIPSVHIACDPAIKLEALALHASQFAGLDPRANFPEEIAEHILANEYFAQIKAHTE